MMKRLLILTLFIAPGAPPFCVGLLQSVQQVTNMSGTADNVPTSPSRGTTADAWRQTIGADDILEFKVQGMPEMTDTVQVASSGEITVGLLGRVRIGGLTVEEAQQEVETKLITSGYLRSPHVSFLLKEVRSQAVNIIGEVNKPGVYQLTGPHRLLDVVYVAGGLTPTAGNEITIISRDQGAAPRKMIVSKNPTEAAKVVADLHPGDTVSVAKAGIVYVIGEVVSPSGLLMDETQNLTALQALASAKGATGNAALNSVRLIRQTPNGLQEIRVPMKKIMQAKAEDIVLKPQDILFLPGSSGKAAAHRTLESIIGITSGLVLRAPI